MVLRSSSTLKPSTTTIRSSPLCLSVVTIRSIKVCPSMGRSALGRPIRLDSPAERTTATIILHTRSRRSHLFVHFVDKTALFKLAHNAIVNNIFYLKAHPRLAAQGFFDLHVHTVARDERDAFM